LRKGHNPPYPAATQQALAAEQMLEAARERAKAAAARAAAARESAARAHDRAAALHERLADACYGDPGEHRRQASWHRLAAEADRGILSLAPLVRPSRSRRWLDHAVRGSGRP
jgi:hypothetical protein